MTYQSLSQAPQPDRVAPPLHRVAAWLVLLIGAALLALAAGCVVLLAYLWWSGPLPPEADGRPAPGNDSQALGAAAGVVVGTLALGLGYGLWSVGRRMPGAPRRLRPAVE